LVVSFTLFAKEMILKLDKKNLGDKNLLQDLHGIPYLLKDNFPQKIFE